MIDPTAPDGHQLRMGFFDHLEELRQRLYRVVLALIIGVVVGAFLTDPLLQYLIEPYADRLLATSPTEPIVAFFRVALLVGGVISTPVIIYQILMFVLPGLTKKERRIFLYALPAVMGLFLTGVAFAWFIVVPAAIPFLEGFMSDTFNAMWTADRYLGFITSLLFWLGVSFELPLVLFLLSILGIVSPRMLLKQWRVAVVLSAVAAAFITPTVDPFNMLIVMAPLVGLYIISIVLSVFGIRINRRARS
ncbi:MAG: twin-arginine translocase subunit TatC [Phototrophicales bacterium]|nr:MAG: twin-arginine translocase subunit TatC [Phototrophicales bacterium]RMG71174.1 MAG: twin-arginine translocase subunit TatC [Chloroflexota bacterium]